MTESMKTIRTNKTIHLATSPNVHEKAIRKIHSRLAYCDAKGVAITDDTIVGRSTQGESTAAVITRKTMREWKGLQRCRLSSEYVNDGS